MKQYNKVIMLLCLLARCLRHLLARQLAATGVEPEEHGLPAVTVPGIHTMAGCLSHKNHI